MPPLANLACFAKLAAPILLTEDFLITKEFSGKSIGTVSEFPVPGTNPPDAKRLPFLDLDWALMLSNNFWYSDSCAL